MMTKAKTTATKTARRAREANDGGRKGGESFSQLFVEASPRIEDPRELQTILNFSLCDLFGICEPYSVCTELLQVRQYRSPDDDDANDNDIDGGIPIARDGGKRGSSKNNSSGHLLVVICPTEYVSKIQAALTFVSPPPYLDDTTYRLDVVLIRRVF
jgi:hypothetical protein